MVGGKLLSVIPDKDGLIVHFKYEDEPWFTQDQQMAIHEICESFLLRNRARERSKRQRSNKTTKD